MTLESMTFFILTGLLILICMIGYLIHLQTEAKPKTVAATPPKQPSASAKSGTIHPGMSDEHFMAIVGSAINHCNVGNERLIAILTAAAAHTLGQPVSVVKFKPLTTMDWTWAVQGRVSLHSHKV